MEGMILAAGLGTRLRPLTNDRPKALVEVGGMTLLERTILRLEDAGVEHIVVNVHHFADMVVDFIRSREWHSTVEISDERALLLDTGGALKHAAPLFSGSANVLVHNVDVLSDLDFRDVEKRHCGEHNLATLCVSCRTTKRMLAFGEDGLLRARCGENGLQGCEAYAFSGITVVSPRLFDCLPEADQPFPIIDEYIKLTTRGERIGSYLHEASRWLDVGKPDTLKQAEQWIHSCNR